MNRPQSADDGSPSTPRPAFGPPALLRHSLAFQAQLLDALGQPVIATDPEGRVLYWNPAAERLYGWAPEEALGRALVDVTPSPLLASRGEEIMSRLRRGESWSGELIVQRKDGTMIPALLTNTPILDSEGGLAAVVGITTDLTERRRLERQLLQSQRMEAVGRLAGGVAHDFNNVLTAIQGHLSFLGEAIRPDDPGRAEVDGIQTAAARAARLTQQLLAFSRRQILSPRTMDLRQVAKGNRDLIEMLGKAGIDVAFKLDERPVYARADLEKLELVVGELLTNAYDASPPRGRVTIEIMAVDVSDRRETDRPGLPVGPYARISVGDEGSGMPPHVLERIFEPFFSTKEAWKSSGLGLGTAYGIVKQSGGHIYGESEPGRGSTFHVYLPRIEAPG